MTKKKAEKTDEKSVRLANRKRTALIMAASDYADAELAVDGNSASFVLSTTLATFALITTAVLNKILAGINGRDGGLKNLNREGSRK